MDGRGRLGLGAAAGFCVALAAAPAGVAAPRVLWAIGWGTPVATREFGKTEHIRAVDSDGAGNVYAVGPSAGANTVRVYGPTGVLAMLPGRGGSDIVLAKVAPSGQLAWARSYGGAGDDGAYDLSLDARGAVLITGRTTAAFTFGGATVAPGGFVAKLDPSGEPVWAAAVAGVPNEQAADTGGNVFVASPAGVDRLDPGGRPSWHQALGGGGRLSPNSVRGVAVAGDGSGDAFVTGQFAGTIALGGLPLSSRGGLDAFVARLRAADGRAVFLMGIGGPSDDYGRGVTVAGRQLYIAGAFEGSADVLGQGRLTSAGGQDVYVAGLDGGGKLLWAAAVGGRAHEEGAEISAGPRGALLIGGSFSGGITVGASAIQSRGGTDFLVAKLGGDGTPLWAAAPLGGAGSDLVYACGADALGGYTFAGGFEGDAQFGEVRLASTGGVDGVFGRIVDDGAGPEAPAAPDASAPAPGARPDAGTPRPPAADAAPAHPGDGVDGAPDAPDTREGGAAPTPGDPATARPVAGPTAAGAGCTIGRNPPDRRAVAWPWLVLLGAALTRRK
jgi:hypothetical protein